MKKIHIATAFLAAALAAGGANAQDWKIAFFAASSQNGFNQATYAGIEERAAELGVETAIFDGQFDAEKQYNQIEDVLASGNYDGFIVFPNDSIGIAGAFEQVIAAGVPIVSTLFPIGPDLNSLEPQVPGITATLASPPVERRDLTGECAGEVLRKFGPVQCRRHHRREDFPVRQSPA